MKFIPWILAIMAGWLIAAPSVLGYANTEIAMKNDVGVGMVMLIGALSWGFSELRHHGLRKDLEAQHR
jgi:hypothetical protein